MSRSSEVERQIRIELLRARAAIERDTLQQQACTIAEQISPASLLQRLVPRPLRLGGTPGLFVQGFSLLRRYPFVLSTLSSVVGGATGSRSRKLLRIGIAGYLAWLAWQSGKKGRE